VRRWNGWTDEGDDVGLPDGAARLLDSIVGPGRRPRDATLDEVVAGVRPSRLPPHPLASGDPVDRIRHARGQSLPDWIALRSGRLGAVPDAVARPSSVPEVRELLAWSATHGASVVPYGGGTSVVGGVTPADDGRPVLTLALERLAGLRGLDPRSGLATFGAGTVGPDLEAALAPHGLGLGHSPQSFERSTVGGWVATRSAGHQSIGVGRIEALFAGGRVEAPAGTLDLPPHPASAAGPDLRQLVLGSEGRFGILTEVTVRALPRPQAERLGSWFLPDWERGLDAARVLAQARLPLSMVRLSTPTETATLLAMADRTPTIRALDRYLRLRRIGERRCLLIVTAAGRRRVVDAALHEARGIVGHSGGVGVGASVGRQWLRGRLRAAGIRDRLWEWGYAVDTLETAVDWTALPSLAEAVGRVLRDGLEPDAERVHAFSHLSHVYGSGSSLYTTFVFRLAADPDETLDRWRRLKRAASDAIVEHGGTISHQHGVGRDHVPWLEAEKGALGMATIATIARRLDPGGLMNPGVLLPADGAAVAHDAAAAGR
jgi:alkyldihydroxyacetonephosphate synthase